MNPQASRQFAIEVVERLRHAGFEALWAGGCVRDQLLGREPKDYDVATNAAPNQIRDLFGHRRTLPIGAAFGVITVLGKHDAGQIEVATFRCDAQYSDGRHPDRVVFSTAEEDAQRRDFTINGLFYDPLAERVIDYVGGQADLERRLIRAIRNPLERFSEDKLRILRAVRFAATFEFAIEEFTYQSIKRLAGEIVIVSAERIAAEMRRMLTHPTRKRAVELLRDTGLLPIILPAANVFETELAEVGTPIVNEKWRRTLAILDRLEAPSFPTALAALLRDLHGAAAARTDEKLGVVSHWKLSNEETTIAHWLLTHESLARRASQIPWPQLQRLLVSDHVAELLSFCTAVCEVLEGHKQEIEHCREKLRLPLEELNPPPLITGNDLKQMGLPPSPAFKPILETVRDAQLEKRVATKTEALNLARSLHP